MCVDCNSYTNELFRVSVIIPVYNVRPYLEESLNSVINQTYRNLEIIVIDDGSADGSGEICDLYAERDDRIVVIHQENHGLSSARNAGLDCSTGQIIAFLDPDDAFCLNMIHLMLEAMVRTKAGIVVCGISEHKTKGKMKPEKLYETIDKNTVIGREEAFRKILNGQINTAVWNRIYNRSIWEGLRFPEGHVYEGTYTVFEVFEKAERIDIIKEKLVMHRIRTGSICNTFSLKNALDSIYSRDHCIDYVKTNIPAFFSLDQLQIMLQNRVLGVLMIYAEYCYKNSKDREGKQIIRKALVKPENDVDLQYCSFPTRACYQLALTVPRLFFFLVLFYRFLKKIGKELRGSFMCI